MMPIDNKCSKMCPMIYHRTILYIYICVIHISCNVLGYSDATSASNIHMHFFHPFTHPLPWENADAECQERAWIKNGIANVCGGSNDQGPIAQSNQYVECWTWTLIKCPWLKVYVDMWQVNELCCPWAINAKEKPRWGEWESTTTRGVDGLYNEKCCPWQFAVMK